MRRHLIEMLNKAIIIVITTTLLLLWLYLPLASHFLRILRVKHRPIWGKVLMRLWSYRSWGMKVVFSWKNATRPEVIYWNELSEWNTCDSGATRLRNKWTRGKQRSKGLLVPFEPKLKHTTMGRVCGSVSIFNMKFPMITPATFVWIFQKNNPSTFSSDDKYSVRFSETEVDAYTLIMCWHLKRSL